MAYVARIISDLKSAKKAKHNIRVFDAYCFNKACNETRFHVQVNIEQSGAPEPTKSNI